MIYARKTCIECGKEKCEQAFDRIRPSKLLSATCRLCEKHAKIAAQKAEAKRKAIKEKEEKSALKRKDQTSPRLIAQEARRKKKVHPHNRLKEVDNEGWLLLCDFPLYEVNEQGDIRGCSTKTHCYYAEELRILTGTLGVKSYSEYINEKKEKPAQEAVQLKYLENDPYKIRASIKTVSRAYLQRAWKQAKRKEVLERGNKSSKESSK